MATKAASAETAVDGKDSSDDETEQLQYKVIILGDGAVGKTSLAMRFTEDVFNQSYRQTIGVDFFIKQLVLPGDVHVAMQLWDIGGHTLGGKMVTRYIFGAQAVLLVYDISNYQSFLNLEDWFNLVKKTFADSPRMPFVAIIANKADLTHIRAVKPDRHNRFADENEMFSFFVSAKTGDNVATSFYSVAAELAGITLTRPELEVASKVVKAQIINHPQQTPLSPQDRRQSRRCSIQ